MPIDDDALTSAMRQAISLAAASPDPKPNPRVGCVLVAPDGSVISTGAHESAGSPHAEIIALTVAGDRARGATAVVTLEPCNHQGRTGPCARALVDAGVTRVVFAQRDPNPEASGGSRTLREAGVIVNEGLLSDEAERLNPQWTRAMARQRPEVTWKLAATLDGFVAAADGTSRWITGPEARRDVHLRRAASDAVLVGTATVLTDDPELTARSDDGLLDPQPWRVVMGQRSVPAGARVRLAEPVDRFWQIPTRDPAFALTQLQRREVRSVLLEGGPALAGAFLRAGLIDSILWYTAPALLGAGLPVVTDLGVTTMADAVRLDLVEVARVGDDVRMELRPTPSDRG